MAWSTHTFPQSWRSAPDNEREAAIVIGNALLASGMEPAAVESVALLLARSTVDVDHGAREQWVVPHARGWAVKAEGAEHASEIFERKSAAIRRAEAIARDQGSAVNIQGEDGRIVDRKTFSSES